MKYLTGLVLAYLFKASGATAQPTPIAGLPAVIHECDIVEANNIKSCGEWRLDVAGNYSGEWPDGSHAKLSVKRFDETEVSIKRQDFSGKSAGWEGEYHGAVRAGQIDGTFTFRKGDFSFSGVWKATFEAPPPRSSMSSQPNLEETKGLTSPNLKAQTATNHSCDRQACGYWSDRHGLSDKQEEFPPAPPAPASDPLLQSKVNINLNGEWEHSSGGKTYERFNVVQLGDAILGKTIEALYWPAGDYFFIGKADSPSTYSGQMIALKANPGDTPGIFTGLQYFPTQLKVLDSDHIVGSYTQNGVTFEFNRVSNSERRHVPCNPKNPTRISGDEAALRASLYAIVDDQQSVNCWAYVAAVQGSAEAQGNYASALLRGVAIPKDEDQAFFWAQKSAMGGSAYGGALLANMFATGTSTRQSQFRAAFWTRRAQEQRSDVVHTKTFNAIPDWVYWKSGPCALSNPGRVDVDQAQQYGYIAYRAGALGISECWFQISAIQGGIKALTYLGLQHLFGLGVAKDPEKGVGFLRRAAKAQEPFAFSYLEQVYRHGIGVPKDLAQAGDLHLAILSGPQRRLNARDRAVHSTTTDNDMRIEDDYSARAGQNSERDTCISFARSRPGSDDEKCGPDRSPSALEGVAAFLEEGRNQVMRTTLGSIDELNPEFEPDIPSTNPIRNLFGLP